MKRWAFNVMTGVSLAMFLVLVVMWIRSFTWTEQFIWSRHAPLTHFSQFFQVVSVRGQIWINVEKAGDSDPSSRPAFGPARMEIFSEPDADDIRLILPAWKRGNGGHHFLNLWGLSYSVLKDPSSQRLAAIQYWLLNLCAAILPLLKASLWCKRRRRARSGLCTACGYDLRATPDRCPECGAVPSAKPSDNGAG